MNRTLLTLLFGIGIGLLIAPARGSETWKRLVNGLDDYIDRAEDETDDLMDTGKKALKKGKSNLQQSLK